MERVRRRRGYLCVASGSRQGKIRKLRVVKTVDDIMYHARMFRFFKRNLVEDLSGLLLVGITLIRWRRCSKE